MAAHQNLLAARLPHGGWYSGQRWGAVNHC